MRVAIIGMGSIGQRHARNVTALGHEALPFDVDQARGRHFSALPNDVDAVMICTPAATHAEVASDLLAIGFRQALFVEKPLALSVAECDVFNTWPHPVVVVGYNWRFNRELGELSRPYARSMRYVCDTDMSSWPGRTYGDPLLECSHEIDLALRWLGESARLQSTQCWEGTRGWIFMAAADGRTAKVEINWAASEPFREYEIITEAGATFIVRPSQRSIDDSYFEEVAYFLSLVKSGSVDARGFLGGLDVIRFCDTIKATPCAL